MNKTCQCVAIDISPTALEWLHNEANHHQILQDRLDSHTMDLSQPNRLENFSADIALMIFSLSAIRPEWMPMALMNAHQCLADHGKLLLRDYGFCDMSQLRYPIQQTFSSQHYIRQDATLAYYFKLPELVRLATDAGFAVEEYSYVCLSLKNRKTNQDMKRVFVHAVFSK